MALLFIIMMIIGLRFLGFSIRVFGKLLGLWITLVIIGAILSAVIGLTFKVLPLLLIVAGIYWLIRKSEEERKTGIVETNCRF